MVAGFRWTVDDTSSVRRWLDGYEFGGAVPSSAVIEVSFGKASQRIVDLPIDLDPLVHKTCAGRVAALPRNADLRDSGLSWRGLDRFDPPADLVAIRIRREKQVRLNAKNI